MSQMVDLSCYFRGQCSWCTFDTENFLNNREIDACTRSNFCLQYFPPWSTTCWLWEWDSATWTRWYHGDRWLRGKFRARWRTFMMVSGVITKWSVQWHTMLSSTRQLLDCFSQQHKDDGPNRTFMVSFYHTQHNNLLILACCPYVLDHWRW